MTLRPLTIACGPYDRTRALADGRVQVEGCQVTYLPLSPEEIFFRAFRHRSFDVTELSLSSTMIQVSRGTCPYVAIPAFVSRSFRHSGIYIRTDRGIGAPADLKGRRVGVPEYQVTAAMWVRGILEDEYGVKPADLEWLTGGIEHPGRHEKVAFDPPPGLRIAAIAADQTLSAMLAAGEIDALVAPRAPSCFANKAPHVGRLFADHRAAERAYYAKTGIFPIMHVIGIRKELVEAAPWLPASVYKALIEAKALAASWLDELAALNVTLPWLAAELEATRAAMGADYWPYGLASSITTLEAAARYSFDQGLSARRLDPAELFHASTLESFKV
jgi:4,5-dihydroxyphthalate decarboxylase